MSIDKQIDKIFDQVDDLCLEGKFEEVDEILKSVDIENTMEELLIAYLAITKAATPKLRWRDRFYSDVFSKFLKTRGISETQNLLKNL